MNSPRWTSLLLLGAIAIFIADERGSAAASGVTLDEVKPADDVSRVLLECEQPGSERPAERLVGLGLPILAQLFEILTDGHFAVRIGEHGNSKRSLSTAQRRVLLEAFRRFPRADLLAFLSGLTETEKPSFEPLFEREVITALELLRELGTCAELPLLLRIGGPASSKDRVPRTVRSSFAEAFERMLRRGSCSQGRVQRAFQNAHPSFLAPMIRTLGKTTSPERLELLTNLLGGIREADILILVEISRQGAKLTHPLKQGVQSAVRNYLWRDDPQILVEACLAAAAVEDREAVPFLIDLLGHENRNVHAKAQQALNELTGRQVAPNPKRWSAWHQQELRWWQTQAQRDFQVIRQGEPAAASELILELSKKRFFRHELTEHLTPGLGRRQTDIAVLTCATLGHLGSWTAIPPLVEALEHSNEEVKSAAWRALRRITGADLGPAPELWRDIAQAQRQRNSS